MSKNIILDCTDCKTQLCCNFFDFEIKNPKLIKDFPAYYSQSTCAANAIKFLAGNIIIDTEKCIFCGICQFRCHQKKIKLPNVFEKNNNKFITSNEKIDNLFFKIYVAKKLNPILPNLLVRNLFISLGIPAAILKKGVTSIRTDLISDNFLCEIEFNDIGGDVLGIPRSILDDVAVICSRQKLKKERFRKIAVVDKLPHIRSEYWEVVYDINKITKVQIETISLFMLISKVWTENKIDSFTNFNFYIDKTNLSYRNNIIYKFCPEIDFSNIDAREEMDVITQTK